MGLTIGLGSAAGGKGKMLIDIGFDVKASPVNNTLTEIPLVDTSYINNASSMFSGCSGVKVFPKINTSRVERMNYMYQYCSLAESFPELDMTCVTDAGYMYNYCSGMKENPPINCPNLLRGNGMFSSCTGLLRVSQLNVKFSDCTEICAYCTNLHTIELIDVSNCTSNLHLGNGSTKLVTCNVVGLKTNIIFTSNSALSKESVLFLFENAQKVSSSKRISLHANTFNQLTADEIAIATQKGFSVISA